jgi:putative membrane protein
MWVVSESGLFRISGELIIVTTIPLMKLISSLVLLLKGCVIGIANVIPGVSGGTMAVVLGIYDRLIEAIGGVVTDGKNRFSHLVFLALVGCGAVLGIVLLAGGIKYMLEHHEALTLLFFMGLILGSTPSVIQASGIQKMGSLRVLSLGLGLGTVLVMGTFSDAKSGLDFSVSSVDYWMLFLGMIAAGGAMIIPGVSGSLMLILLGQYAVVLGAIHDRNLKVLAIAGIGAGLGILLFSKIIRYLLQHHAGVTHAFIIGLVAGSIVVIYRGFPAGDSGLLLGLAGLLAGTLVAYLSGSGPRKG